MGNKLIKLGSNSSNTKTELEVYRDLSMDSKPKKGSYVVDKLVNVKAVQNALHNIFSWMPGERVLLPEFGSNLPKLLYRGITPETQEAIVAEINHCIIEWEPRVIVDKVVNIGDVNDTENNTIRLEVRYHIKGLSNEQYSYQYDYNRSI